MDQRTQDALSLMLDALLLLDECQEYAAAAHLQSAIDALPDPSRRGDRDASTDDGPAQH